MYNCIRIHTIHTVYSVDEKNDFISGRILITSALQILYKILNCRLAETTTVFVKYMYVGDGNNLPVARKQDYFQILTGDA